jgi:UDP-glucose 4-epimerase
VISRKSILITGAAGFIGGYVASHFGERGWRVTAVDRNETATDLHLASVDFRSYIKDDLTEVSRLSRILDENRPDVCIHLAAPANVGLSFRQPLEDFLGHTLPLLRILEAIRQCADPPQLLLVSSAAVYGNPESFPVAEEHRIRPISPYGFHKYQQEILLDEYRVLYGLRVCKARIFSTYGPGLKQLAVWDITQRAIAGDYTVRGTGEETRDYLFIADVAEAIRCIAENAPFSGEAINVASGQEIPISRLAAMIYSQLGGAKRPELVPIDSDPGNPKRWRADTTRLQQLGFAQRTSLDCGLRLTVDWIKLNA